MFRITWLIIMDFTQATLAYTTWEAHGFESGPVLPSQVSVRITWVCHGMYLLVNLAESNRTPWQVGEAPAYDPYTPGDRRKAPEHLKIGIS